MATGILPHFEDGWSPIVDDTVGFEMSILAGVEAMVLVMGPCAVWAHLNSPPWEVVYLV